MNTKAFKLMCVLFLFVTLSSCGDSSSDSSDPVSFLNTSCEETWTRYYSMFSVPVDWIAKYAKFDNESQVEQKYEARQESGNVAISISEDDETDNSSTSKSEFISQCKLRQEAYTQQQDKVSQTTVEGQEVLHVSTSISYDLAMKIISSKDDGTEFASKLSENQDATVHYIADVSYDGFIINETLYFEDSTSTKYTNSYKVSNLKL